MRTVKASEFKAQCLALMDEVNQTQEPVLVTKNGKPVAELHPYAGGRRLSPFGLHEGQVRIEGDIVGTVFDDEWEALP